MRHRYLLGYQHLVSLCFLLAVCASASLPILPGAQRCWPRARAEFGGLGVEVNVTASLRALQYTFVYLRNTVSSRVFIIYHCIQTR